MSTETVTATTAAAVPATPATATAPAVAAPVVAAPPATQDEKNAAAAAAVTPAAAPAATVYEFKVPEAAKRLTGEPLVVDSDLAALKAFAAEKKLSPEHAQMVLDQRIDAMQYAEKRMMDDFETQKASWKAASLSDPRFGGEKEFGKNVELAKRALDAVATPKFKQFLEDHGFDNEPETLATFLNIGKKMAEPSLAPLDRSSSPEVVTPEAAFDKTTQDFKKSRGLA